MSDNGKISYEGSIYHRDYSTFRIFTVEVCPWDAQYSPCKTIRMSPLFVNFCFFRYATAFMISSLFTLVFLPICLKQKGITPYCKVKLSLILSCGSKAKIGI